MCDDGVEKKSHMVTIRMTAPMKLELGKATAFSGRSLSGEIQHRLTEYALLRALIDAKMINPDTVT